MMGTLIMEPMLCLIPPATLVLPHILHHMAVEQVVMVVMIWEIQGLEVEEGHHLAMMVDMVVVHLGTKVVVMVAEAAVVHLRPLQPR